MLDVQFLVKSFMRPAVLQQCLQSIRKYYPQPILLADDSHYFSENLLKGIADVTYYPMPYGSGLSAGRNHLLSQVTSEYFVLLDHDQLLMNEHSIAQLFAVMQRTNATIVSGRLWDVGVPSPRAYFGHFSNRGRDILLNHYDPVLTKYHDVNSVRYCGCRYGSNFFLGRTADFMVRKIQWDPDLKLMEHEDFFLRLPDACRVVTAPDVHVRHLCCYPESKAEPEYAKYRHDPTHRERVRAKYQLKSEFFLERHGVIYNDWRYWLFPKVRTCLKSSEPA